MENSGETVIQLESIDRQFQEAKNANGKLMALSSQMVTVLAGCLFTCDVSAGIKDHYHSRTRPGRLCDHVFGGKTLAIKADLEEFLDFVGFAVASSSMEDD